jgi:hypothetical protein
LAEGWGGTSTMWLLHNRAILNLRIKYRTWVTKCDVGYHHQNAIECEILVRISVIGTKFQPPEFWKGNITNLCIKFEHSCLVSLNRNRSKHDISIIANVVRNVQLFWEPNEIVLEHMRRH